MKGQVGGRSRQRTFRELAGGGRREILAAHFCRRKILAAHFSRAGRRGQARDLGSALFASWREGGRSLQRTFRDLLAGRGGEVGDLGSALLASWRRAGRRVLLTAHFSRAGDWGKREILTAHFSRSGGGGGQGGDLGSALFTRRFWQHTFPELAGRGQAGDLGSALFTS